MERLQYPKNGTSGYLNCQDATEQKPMNILSHEVPDGQTDLPHPCPQEPLTFPSTEEDHKSLDQLLNNLIGFEG